MGFPSPAQDYIEAPLDLNSYFEIGSPSVFFFAVGSDSMIGAGITERHKLIVDRSVSLKENDIVIAVVNEKFIVRRIITHNGKRILNAENLRYRNIPIEEATIWGVVTGSFIKY